MTHIKRLDPLVTTTALELLTTVQAEEVDVKALREIIAAALDESWKQGYNDGILVAEVRSGVPKRSGVPNGFSLGTHPRDRP